MRPPRPAETMARPFRSELEHAADQCGAGGGNALCPPGSARCGAGARREFGAAQGSGDGERVGLSTSGALFAVLLLVIIVLIGALSLLPAFALGPLAEQFMGAF